MDREMSIKTTESEQRRKKTEKKMDLYRPMGQN